MDTPAEAGDVEPKSSRPRASMSEVRVWARRKGFEVGARGHIAEEIIKQFNRTHNKRADSRNPWKG